MPHAKSSLISKAQRFAKIMSVTMASLWKVRRLKKPTDAQVYALTRAWALEGIKILGIHEIKVTGAPIEQGPCLFLGNHMSYVDIPLLFTLHHFVFVAKKEVADWPVFGPGATEVGTIYVDRSSFSSRKRVGERILEGIVKDGKSIVVFPEGTSSVSGKPWKRGSVSLAKDNNITVQAFRVAYKPAREVAFVGDDALHTHLWNLLGFENIEASVEFFPPIKVQDTDADVARLEELVHKSLAKALEGQELLSPR